MAGARKKKVKAAAASIRKRHWDTPVSFHSDGIRLATLRQYVDPTIPTLTLAELNPNQRLHLVMDRLSRLKRFGLVLLTAGPVDKERAIAEVQARTPVGAVIAHIEHRVMQRLVAHARSASEVRVRRTQAARRSAR